MVRGVGEVTNMVDVKSMCGVCLMKRKICPACYPEIRSAKALHEEMPKGCYAHCEGCHSVLMKMQEESCDEIVIHWV